MTNTQTTPAGSSSTTTKPCGCGAQHNGSHKKDCCCGLECFERSNYFCGHLLTDTDLKLDQKYVIGKNKLYHRAIHGHGVVCGLRMSCDPSCEGTIMVGDGYAIDDCGNDLIVCKPQRVTIVSEPAKKKKDPCDDPKREPDCMIRQCYYLAICYDEQPSDYTTPFKASCGSGPSACEPTRIHEAVKFKVFDKLPHNQSALERIECRIENCFKILTEGDFSDLLKQYATGFANNQRDQNPCNTFAKLKVYLRRWLDSYPDPVNCCLRDELCRLECPKDADNNAVDAAFETLLKLVLTYIDDCVRYELVFCCDEPECPSCVILGTVEVVNGKICKICTCHRQYVWTAANLIDVLLYEVLVGLECSASTAAPIVGKERQPEPVHQCCPGLEIESARFLNLFSKDRRASLYAATSPIQAMRSAASATTKAFSYTDPDVVSARVFENLNQEQAQTLAKTLSLNLLPAQQQVKLDALTAMLPSLLLRSGDQMVLQTTDKNVVQTAIPTLQAPIAQSLDYAKNIADLQNQLKEMQARLDKLQPPPPPAPAPGQ